MTDKSPMAWPKSNPPPEIPLPELRQRSTLNIPLYGWAGIAASLITLGLAITFPAWFPRFVRSVVPDRYIVAYAPGFIRDIAFSTDQEELLPTAIAVDSTAAESLLTDLNIAIESTSTPTVVSPAMTASPLVETAEAHSVLPQPPDSMILNGFTFQAQGWNKCGPATLAMNLSFWGVDVSQNAVSDAIKPHPEDSNVSPDELAAFARVQGFGAITRINGTLDILKQFVSMGYPVLIERGFDELPESGWMGHYMLLIGYSDVNQEFYALDSYWGLNRSRDNYDFPYDTWSYERVEELWRDFNKTYIIVYPSTDQEIISVVIGEDMNEDVMLQRALSHAYDEVNKIDDTFAWYNLGSVLVHLGDFEAAATAFDVARDRGIPWRMYWYQFDLYEAYFQVGRYEDVMVFAQFTTDITNYPESEEGHYYIGRVQAARGQVTAARNSFNTALRYNPTYTPAQEALDALDG